MTNKVDQVDLEIRKRESVAFMRLVLWAPLVVYAGVWLGKEDFNWQPTERHFPETQPAIETEITQVRGCDIIQYIQGDRLIAAFPAPDQPKTCKIQGKTANNSPKRGGK